MNGIIEVVISLEIAAAQPADHGPVVPRELPDDIRFLYRDGRGRQRDIALGEANEIDFSQTRPFREPSAYRGQRNFPGWWWSATTRSHVVYKSWLGRHHIVEADRDVRVIGIAGQPFALTWPAAEHQAEHVPDLLCRMLDGGVVVTDCRRGGKPR